MAMLLFVILGFSRTFFFRALSDVPSIPTYLYVHGASLTLWFVWFLIQTSLIASNLVALHRRFGLGGVLIAASVVITSLIAVLNLPSRVMGPGSDVDPQYVSTLVINDLITLVIFSSLVTGAVLNRRRPESHKRLMYFAALSILGPVVRRLTEFPESYGIVPGVLAAAFLITFLVAPILYDFLARGKPHVITAISLPVIIGGAVLGTSIAATTFGQDLVMHLG